jgi:hypothetical protein
MHHLSWFDLRMALNSPEFDRMAVILRQRLVEGFRRVDGPLDMRTSDAVLAYSIAMGVVMQQLVAAHKLLMATDTCLAEGRVTTELRDAAEALRRSYEGDDPAS